MFSLSHLLADLANANPWTFYLLCFALLITVIHMLEAVMAEISRLYRWHKIVRRVKGA